MMSSFHEDSGFTPVENLNNSNIHRVMSPVALLNKSDFTTPKMPTEVDLTTPAHVEKEYNNARNIPTSANNDFSEASIDPIRLEIHEFNSADSFPVSLATTSQVEAITVDPSPVTIESSTPSANESQSNDEDESLRFALQLQYQEEEELIQMQLANLRAVVIAGGLSGDDISTMQLMMSDLQHQLQYVRASAAALNAPTQATTDHTGDNDDDRSFVDSQAGDEEQGRDDEGNEAEEEEEEEEQWDYEQLLQLGQRLGDVKTERWRMRAQSVIDTLPVLSYGELREKRQGVISVVESASAVVVDLVDDADILNLLNDSNSSVLGNTSAMMDTKIENGQSVKKAKLSHDGRETETLMTPAEKTKQNLENQQSQSEDEEEHCIVCMEPYVPEDMVKQLPCKHFFHCHCTQGWLVDHNSCPYCKTKVTATP